MAVVVKLLLLCCTLGYAYGQGQAYTGGAALHVPTQLSSSNGLLDTTLTVAISDLTVDWQVSQRRLYNGGSPGPTLRVRPGDRMLLNLVNNLGTPDYFPTDGSHLRVLHSPNATNFHTHGLHISPKEPQDNIFHAVNAMSSYQYDFSIKSDQPAGTYWYHPHNQGSAAFQIESGMSGMLIVEDEVGSTLAGLPEVQMLLQMYRYQEPGGFISMQTDMNDFFRLDSAMESWLMNATNAVNYMIVNGKLWPNIPISANKDTRFRIANTNQLYGMAIYFTNANSLSCTIREIAVDGVYLDAPRTPRLGKTFIAAGARVDLLVNCPAGVFTMESIHVPPFDTYSFGYFPMMYTGVLANVTATSDGTTNTFTGSLPAKPSYLADLQTKTENELGGRFAVEITPTTTLNREDFSHASYFRYKMEVDTIQELIFTNPGFAISHPMHMHTNHMQVISYNNYTGPVSVDEGQGGSFDGLGEWTLFDQTGQVCTYQHDRYNATAGFVWSPFNLFLLGHADSSRRAESVGYHTIGDWIDTLQVPPLANITVRFKADTFTGPTAIHCHTTIHQDRGQMMAVEIVEAGANLTANVGHGVNNLHPWSCMTNDPVGLWRTTAGSSIVASSIVTVFASAVLAAFGLLL